MRLTVARTVFKSALDRVVPLAAGKNIHIPILRNVLLAADEGKLFLYCGNSEIFIKTHIPCEVKDVGEFTVPARLLLDVVNAAAGDIEMSVDKDTLHVTSGRSKWKLLGMTSKEYPTMPRVNDGVKFEMPLVVLRQVIQQSVFACAKDETRISLLGVRFAGTGQDPHMEIASTDTFRVTLRTIELDEPVATSFILPKETAAVVMRTLDGDGDVSITVNDRNGVEMEAGETLIYSRLVDASGFPNVKRIIPTGFTTDFRIERKTLSEIVRRVSLVVNEGENKVVVFSVDEHSITIMGRGDNTGVAEETVDHLGGTGQMQFCMMVNYIQEMLSALDDEILRVQAVGHLIPVMFTGDNQDYLYLQAPCNIPAWAKVETEALKAA